MTGGADPRRSSEGSRRLRRSDRRQREMRLDRTVVLWLAVGWIGYAILPWYAIDGGFWSFEWLLDDWPLDDDTAPALLQALFFGKWWLAPIVLPLLAPLALIGRRRSDPAFANVLIAIGLVGLGYVLLQGFAIGLRGWQFDGPRDPVRAARRPAVRHGLRRPPGQRRVPVPA